MKSVSCRLQSGNTGGCSRCSSTMSIRLVPGVLQFVRDIDIEQH